MCFSNVFLSIMKFNTHGHVGDVCDIIYWTGTETNEYGGADINVFLPFANGKHYPFAQETYDRGVERLCDTHEYTGTCARHHCCTFSTSTRVGVPAWWGVVCRLN